MIAQLLLGVLLGLLATSAGYTLLWLDRSGTEVAGRLGVMAIWGALTGCAWVYLLRPQIPGVETHLGQLGSLFVLAAVSVVQVAGLTRMTSGEGPASGVIHGLALGAGFAVVAGGLPATAEFPAVMALSLVAGAVLGAGAGFAEIEPRLVRTITALVGVSLIAAGLQGALPAVLALPLHLSSNELIFAVSASGALLAGALVALAMRADGRILRRELAEEARLGVLPERVAVLAPSFRQRIRSVWWRDGAERRAVNLLLLRLAIRKHRVRRMSAARGRVAGLEIGRMRERAKRLFSPVEGDED